MPFPGWISTRPRSVLTASANRDELILKWVAIGAKELEAGSPTWSTVTGEEVLAPAQVNTDDWNKARMRKNIRSELQIPARIELTWRYFLFLLWSFLLLLFCFGNTFFSYYTILALLMFFFSFLFLGFGSPFDSLCTLLIIPVYSMIQSLLHVVLALCIIGHLLLLLVHYSRIDRKLRRDVAFELFTWEMGCGSSGPFDGCALYNFLLACLD